MQVQRAATRLDLTVKKPELLHRPAAWRPRQTASPSDRLQESEVNESMRRQLLISNMLIRREQQSTAVCRQPGNVLQLRERSNIKPIRMEAHLRPHRRKQSRIGCKRTPASWWDGLSVSPGDEDESPVGKKGIKRTTWRRQGGEVVTRLSHQLPT